jgi:hypothetical protein
LLHRHVAEVIVEAIFMRQVDRVVV